MLADRTQARKTVVFLVCILFAVFNTSQPFLSALLGPKIYNKCPTVSKNQTNHGTEHVRDTGLWSWNEIFYIILLVNFIAGFTNQSYLFTSEVAVYKIKRSTRNPQYGRQFMFATFGFGIATTISGKFLDAFPKASVSCYSAVFLFCLAISLVQTAVMQILYKETSNNSENRGDSTNRFRQSLWHVLKDIDLIMHYTSVFVAGFLYQVYRSYFFIFLKSLNAPNILIGLTIASGSTSGFLASLISPWRVKGVWNAYAIAMFSIGARFILVSFLVNPWFAIPIQLLLHGSVTLIYVFNAENIKRKEEIPVNLRATLFGVQGCLFNGIGPLLGGGFGGFFYHGNGARKLFQLMTALSCGWAILIAIYKFVLLLQRKRSYEKINDALSNTNTEEL